MTSSVLSIKIIAVGKMKDRCLKEKVEDYLQRTRHDSRVELVEVRDSTPDAEGVKLCEILSKENGFVFALTEEGRQYDSVAFAKRISIINGKIIFIIGGPFGLTDTVKKRAHEIFSLSKMTFTHEMARMLLLEQIYRAVSIINNRGYHKE
jgi:23S rRNA (pseudouridine1915-N3)-methyltransferase